MDASTVLALVGIGVTLTAAGLEQAGLVRRRVALAFVALGILLFLVAAWGTWGALGALLAATVAVVGLAILLLLHRPRAISWRPRGIGGLRRRWRMRHWTSAGLNWRVLPESHGVAPDGRMHAILSITPAPGSELPQPLDFVVICAGLIAEVSSRFYFDQANPGGESSGDIEIDAPEGKSVRFKLVSPKLLPPARLDLTLHSKGNAEVKVVDVKRAP